MIDILKVSIPITICSLLSAMTKTIDALTIVRMLKGIIGEEQAKIQYGILNGKVDTLIMLPFSFNIAFATALVPTISGAIAKNELNIAKKRISFSILITILIGVPCSIIMSVFSKEFFGVLFPNALEGNLMLKYSSISIIFVVLTQTINGALQGMGKTNISIIAFTIGSIFKLTLNILLIPILRINGAIFGTIICDIVSFAICYIELKRNLKIRLKASKYIIKPIIAACSMLLSTYLIYINLNIISIQSIKFIISILIGIICYIISIIFLKIFSKEEVFMLPYGQLIYKKLNFFKSSKPL